MFGNMLTPKNIIGFIKNNADKFIRIWKIMQINLF